jgi:hypothetical protein
MNRKGRIFGAALFYFIPSETMTPSIISGLALQCGFNSEVRKTMESSISMTGMKHFVTGDHLVKTCETVANYCTCRSEGPVHINDSVTTKYYSTGDFLDSIQYSDGDWVVFHWNRTQASLRRAKPRHSAPDSFLESLTWRRDLLGRNRKGAVTIKVSPVSGVRK